MAQLADALNQFAFTGETCEWCESEVIVNRETDERECECFDADTDDD